MSSYTVLDHGNKNARSFDSRKEADEKAKGVKSMVNDSTQIEVGKGEYKEYADYEQAKTDGGIQEDATEAQPVPTETNTDSERHNRGHKNEFLYCIRPRQQKRPIV